jgi:hypothetical protein
MNPAIALSGARPALMAVPGPIDDAPYGSPGEISAEIAVIKAVYEAFARRDVEAAIGLQRCSCWRSQRLRSGPPT